MELETKLEEKDDIISKLNCARLVADKLNKQMNSDKLRFKEEKEERLRKGN